MNNWDEIKTAYQVARLGTVSGAADVLGVHHATVIRHIDALEANLDVKLFQRHSRGYTATDAGRDLFRVAQATADQFEQLSSRIQSSQANVSGELIVTAAVENAGLLVDAVKSFQDQHPEIRVRCLAEEDQMRLEYGAAHVAIKTGHMPNKPDNIVQRIHSQRMALFASSSYLNKYGQPEGIDDLARHRFVAHDHTDHRAPFNRWLRAHVPSDRVVFRSANLRVLELAVRSGIGIGFLNMRMIGRCADIHRVLINQKEWASPLWVVTHADQHHTVKVQAFVEHLKIFLDQEDNRGPILSTVAQTG